MLRVVDRIAVRTCTYIPTYRRIIRLQLGFVFEVYNSDIIVRNHVKLGVSPRILYFVVDTDYGLSGSLGLHVKFYVESRRSDCVIVIVI